ncbi:hypothetical protein AB0L06_04100 [Spirillospora sp. NPDC052269]
MGPTGGTSTSLATGLPYLFNAASYNALTATTTGTFTGLRFTVKFLDGCLLQIGGPGGTTGTLNWSLHGSQLAFSGGNLTLSANFACDPLLYNSGDSVSANGTYTLTAPPTITSP